MSPEREEILVLPKVTVSNNPIRECVEAHIEVYVYLKSEIGREKTPRSYGFTRDIKLDIPPENDLNLEQERIKKEIDDVIEDTRPELERYARSIEQLG